MLLALLVRVGGLICRGIGGVPLYLQLNLESVFGVKKAYFVYMRRWTQHHTTAAIHSSGRRNKSRQRLHRIAFMRPQQLRRLDF
jgi:hypothetical protein